MPWSGRCLAVPPVVLGWSHKYAEVMARFGLEDQVMDYAAMDRTALEQAVLAVFAQRAGLVAAIRERLPAIRPMPCVRSRSCQRPAGADR